MARFAATDLARIRALTDALGTLVLGAPPALSGLMPGIAALLECDHSLAYHAVSGGYAVRFDFFWTHGCSRRFESGFDTAVQRTPARWGLYDPSRPEPAQRNVAMTNADLLPMAGGRPASMFVNLGRLGVPITDQLRVLVCDGPMLLGWVGGFRDRPFTDRNRRLLARLVPALRRRLQIGRELDAAALHAAGLIAALEAIPGAAFVLGPGLVIAHANAAGRALVERDRSGTHAALAASTRSTGEGGAFTITRLSMPGVTEHHLAVRRAPADPDDRAGMLARRWRLTPRQTAVLALVARGMANKSIAEVLGCAVSTVEIHVTALLGRAEVENRTTLVVRFWSER